MQMARALGTDHQVVEVSDDDIGRVIPDVIWHTETPITRTSPAAMFLLSKLVQRRGRPTLRTEIVGLPPIAAVALAELRPELAEPEDLGP